MSGKRIVIKLGTSTLTGGGTRLSRRAMLSIAAQTAELLEAGHEITLVSSGAMAAGREALGFTKLPPHIAGKQMLSAIGQTRLMQFWAELFAIYEHTVGQVLLTRGDLARRSGYLNARDALDALLAAGVVPIVNENDTVATDEIRVGDNDNLSALVANLTDADLLIILSDISGLYTADPRSNPEAQFLAVIEHLDESHFAMAGGSGSALGTGGMTTKLQAAQLAGQSGTTTVIAPGTTPNILCRIVAGEPLGTTILPLATRRESRERWLLAERPQGVLHVDSGAVRRLRQGGASLLPVGITEIEGSFDRGDAIKLLAPNGSALAVGLAAYSADELRQLKGRSSRQIAHVLGYTFGDEAVHRDNLVLL
ncbi:glutamate 5-kinase [Armatimonas rosea]|uniref:Glutamate 5-kinase n=1 Tax=Armatimonas rosea TaxID=685828 RepID=A0A7W9SSD4_ARMRO|nr:glutamate 5-kinase [Armatimonas rosea]